MCQSCSQTMSFAKDLCRKCYDKKRNEQLKKEKNKVQTTNLKENEVNPTFTNRQYHKHIEPMILNKFGTIERFYEFLKGIQSFRSYWRNPLREMRRKTLQNTIKNVNQYLRQGCIQSALANNHSSNQWEIFRKAVTYKSQSGN